MPYLHDQNRETGGREEERGRERERELSYTIRTERREGERKREEGRERESYVSERDMRVLSGAAVKNTHFLG